MSSQNADQPNSETPIEKISDQPTDPNTAQTPSEEKSNESIRDGDNKEKENGEDEEEEEEGECGFCLFMKGGGCKEAFTEWEKCMEEGEREGTVGKCYQLIANLKKCMEEHSDYYAPLLEVEKAAEAEAAKQLEEESDGSKQLEKKSS